MIIWITAALPWLIDRAGEFADFLRSIPSLLAPKPAPLSSPYTPPYLGGQCPVIYIVSLECFASVDGIEQNFTGVKTYSNLGLIGAFGTIGFELNNVSANGQKNYNWFIYTNNATEKFQVHSAGRASWQSDLTNGRVSIVSMTRRDGQPDNCGNLGNPTPPPSISDDGLFNPTNPHIGDNNGNVNESAIVLAPALPLVLVSAILAGYSAAMAAAAAASDALAAVKKIAEGLDALKTLWEKLKEFLDEWEKNRPKKRDIVRQTYGRILGDGALDFFPNNNTKFKAIQLDVVITNIPIGFGRYFGSLSPSRYRYKELGYIAFYSVNQGILETHSIQFKRTSYQIPELAVGFIYHLGLDEQVRGYSFGTFSVEKT